MREFDRAAGEIASCCSVLGLGYRVEWGQNGGQYFIIGYGKTAVTVSCHPADSKFTMRVERRLTNIEGVGIADAVPVVNYEESAEHGTPVRVKPIVEEVDAVEYLDGFRAERPLFVYSDGFGPQAFDESAASVTQACSDAFSNLLEQTGIDLTDSTAAESGNAAQREGARRGYQ